MDLVELREPNGLRHPWELARIEAVKKVLAPHLFAGIRVLDFGCGDGFVARRLFAAVPGKEVTAVDVNFNDQRMEELQRLDAGIRYLKEAPGEGRFDLVLVMDVIEHVADDVSLLSSIVDKYLASGGRVLLTVPSFQFLYGHHDVVLGHYRRYRLSVLEQAATASALRVTASGYLFGSLLLPKLMYNLLSEAGIVAAGVGTWRGGKSVSTMAEGLLKLDNRVLLSAARRRIKIPGLSAWALCEKASR